MTNDRSTNNVLNDVDSQSYWRENHRDRPYSREAYALTPDLEYDRDFSQAYELGRHARNEAPENSRYEDIEADLETKWGNLKAESRLKWEQAKFAVKDAWDKM